MKWLDVDPQYKEYVAEVLYEDYLTYVKHQRDAETDPHRRPIMAARMTAMMEALDIAIRFLVLGGDTEGQWAQVEASRKDFIYYTLLNHCDKALQGAERYTSLTLKAGAARLALAGEACDLAATFLGYVYVPETLVQQTKKGTWDIIERVGDTVINALYARHTPSTFTRDSDVADGGKGPRDGD